MAKCYEVGSEGALLCTPELYTVSKCTNYFISNEERSLKMVKKDFCIDFFLVVIIALIAESLPHFALFLRNGILQQCHYYNIVNHVFNYDELMNLKHNSSFTLLAELPYFRLQYCGTVYICYICIFCTCVSDQSCQLILLLKLL